MYHTPKRHVLECDYRGDAGSCRRIATHSCGGGAAPEWNLCPDHHSCACGAFFVPYHARLVDLGHATMLATTKADVRHWRPGAWLGSHSRKRCVLYDRPGPARYVRLAWQDRPGRIVATFGDARAIVHAPEGGWHVEYYAGEPLGWCIADWAARGASIAWQDWFRSPNAQAALAAGRTLAALVKGGRS